LLRCVCLFRRCALGGVAAGPRLTIGLSQPDRPTACRPGVSRPPARPSLASGIIGGRSIPAAPIEVARQVAR
jgi:hypothetical protein